MIFKNVPEWIEVVLLFAAVILISLLLTGFIVGVVNTVHSDKIEACDRLEGDIVRSYKCLLPSGELVDPVRWENSR